MPLDNYIGQSILIRFNLRSDNGGNYDGFYFDDLKVEKIVNTPQGVNENATNGFMLSQNMPNPAGNETSIAYSLPDGISNASLQIYKTNYTYKLVFFNLTLPPPQEMVFSLIYMYNWYNAVGQIVKEEKLVKSAGTMVIDISTMAKGMYYYKIAAGNLQSAVVKMVIVK